MIGCEELVLLQEVTDELSGESRSDNVFSLLRPTWHGISVCLHLLLLLLLFVLFICLFISILFSFFCFPLLLLFSVAFISLNFLPSTHQMLSLFSFIKCKPHFQHCIYAYTVFSPLKLLFDKRHNQNQFPILQFCVLWSFISSLPPTFYSFVLWVIRKLDSAPFRTVERNLFLRLILWWIWCISEKRMAAFVSSWLKNAEAVIVSRDARTSFKLWNLSAPDLKESLINKECLSLNFGEHM